MRKSRLEEKETLFLEISISPFSTPQSASSVVLIELGGVSGMWCQNCECGFDGIWININ